MTEFVVENPYKGLRAFGEADAGDFFGRAALTQRLLERLAEEDAEARFLAVIGPSGSGKSSVVRAGLIPALRHGGLPGSERWFVVELLPGAHPFEELEAALLRIAVNPPESLLNQLREDERGLARAVKRTLPADEETELVLIIDQFEEMFTLVEDEAVRAHLLDSLVAAVLDARSRLRVVITLRADFMDRPLQYIVFGDLLRQRAEFVLPLTPEELERAIVGPAERAGLALEPSLAATIIHEVGEQPGTLPLLQYALTELFEQRAGHTLTLAAYRMSGGVRGALARRADEIYLSLDSNRQEAVRQLFLRLITLGEGSEDTRRRVLQAEIASLTTGHPLTPDTTIPDQSLAIEVVIERYGRARLLSFDRDPITREPTVEVAHEALLREWGRLRAWLDASRDDLRVQRRLAAAALEWWLAGRDASFLVGGARLAQFESWAAQTDVALTADERTFLVASVAERDRQDAVARERQAHELEQARALAGERMAVAVRLRRRSIYLAVALVLALIAAGGAGIFARVAHTNLARAESLRLADEASNVLDHGDSGDLPVLLVLRSLQYSQTGQAFNTLRSALARPLTRQRFIGHSGSVLAVAFSPDGRTVLTGSDDQTARLWDAATGQQLRIFTGHTGKIRAVAFSPDGRTVLTGSDDGTARLWNVETGQQQRKFKSIIGGRVWCVAFSPDGTQILTGGDDYRAWLWDVESGKLLRFFPAGSLVRGVDFSPDGKQVAIASQAGSAQLWDIATGNILRLLLGHAASVNSVAFTPDGQQLMTTSDDFTGRLWNVQTGALIRQFEGHKAEVLSGAVSPNGAFVLTSSNDRTVRLWNITTGQQLQVYLGHTNAIGSVAFSPDGRQIITGSNDGTARAWDTQADKEPFTFIGHTGKVVDVAFAPDGKQVLTASEDMTARLWDAQTGQPLHILRGHTGRIWTVAFSPDGRYVATGSGNDDEPTARIWDAQSGQQLRVLKHGAWVGGLVFSRDGEHLFTCSGDGFIRLWSVATGQEIRRFSVPADWWPGLLAEVYTLAVSPDGKYVLTGSADKTARLWDAQTGQQLRVFSGHTDVIWSVAFSPDGKYVFTGSGDRTARLWDAQTGQQLRIFTGHTEGIRRVAFSPDGTTVLTGSFDGAARLWDVATGQQLRIFREHTDGTGGVAYSPDGKTILTGSDDHIARLWHLDDRDLVLIACAALQRDFTNDERVTYGIADNAKTCPKP